MSLCFIPVRTKSRIGDLIKPGCSHSTNTGRIIRLFERASVFKSDYYHRAAWLLDQTLILTHTHGVHGSGSVVLFLCLSVFISKCHLCRSCEAFLCHWLFCLDSDVLYFASHLDPCVIVECALQLESWCLRSLADMLIQQWWSAAFLVLKADYSSRAGSFQYTGLTGPSQLNV